MVNHDGVSQTGAEGQHPEARGFHSLRTDAVVEQDHQARGGSFSSRSGSGKRALSEVEIISLIDSSDSSRASSPASPDLVALPGTLAISGRATKRQRLGLLAAANDAAVVQPSPSLLEAIKDLITAAPYQARDEASRLDRLVVHVQLCPPHPASREASLLQAAVQRPASGNSFHDYDLQCFLQSLNIHVPDEASLCFMAATSEQGDVGIVRIPDCWAWGILMLALSELGVPLASVQERSPYLLRFRVLPNPNKQSPVHPSVESDSPGPSRSPPHDAQPGSPRPSHKRDVQPEPPRPSQDRDVQSDRSQPSLDRDTQPSPPQSSPSRHAQPGSLPPSQDQEDPSDSTIEEEMEDAMAPSQDEEQIQPDKALASLVDMQIQADEMADWPEVCAFFAQPQHHVDSNNPSHRLKFPGLKRAMMPHQLTAVYRMFSMPQTSRDNAILLADGMGLGKTTMSIFFSAVSHQLRRAVREVRRSRRAKNGKHCPGVKRGDPEQQAGSCPSGDYAFGIQCPCIHKSMSQRFLEAKVVPDGCTVIMIPPHLHLTWCRELVETLESPRRIFSFCSVKKPYKTLFSSISFCDSADDDAFTPCRADVNKLEVDGKPTWVLRSKKNDELGNVFILLPKSTTLKRLAATVIGRIGPRGKETRGFPVRPGLVVMDEMHEYKSKNSIPWAFSHNLLKARDNVMSFIAISGTPLNKGPSDLQGLASAMEILSRDTKGANFQAKLSDWAKKHNDYIHAQLAESGATNCRRGFGAAHYLAEANKLGSAFLSGVIVRRLATTLLGGKPILDIPPADATIYKSPSSEPHKELVDQVMERSRTNASSNDDFADAIMRHGVSSIYDVLLCATAPGFARFILGTDAATRLPLRQHDLKHTLSRDPDAQHPYHPFLGELVDGSSKIEKLAYQVRKMLQDQSRHRNLDDGDEPLPKKMVIFYQRAPIGHLIVLVLRREFPDIRIELLDGNTPDGIREDVFVMFGRPTTQHYVEDDSPEDIRVLVASTTVAATGYNFQRASYVCAVEPSWTRDIDDQAIARVVRQGQHAETHVVDLVACGSIAEEGIRAKAAARFDSARAAFRQIGQGENKEDVM